jgi:hypothetical protein
MKNYEETGCGIRDAGCVFRDARYPVSRIAHHEYLCSILDRHDPVLDGEVG